MSEELIKFFSIFLLTMVKFIAGPVGGYAAGFSLFTTIVVTILGMMSSVMLFTFLGTFIRERIFSRLFKKRNTFTKRNRKFVTIWRKYGVIGVAALTPLLLTPIGGTLLLTSFRTPKSLIMMYMSISSVIWAIVMSSIIFLAGEQLMKIMG
jgi:hypothetical protein